MYGWEVYRHRRLHLATGPGSSSRSSTRSTPSPAVGPGSASGRPGPRRRQRAAARGPPFPPLAERFERLAETLEICLRRWSDDESPYSGRHHRSVLSAGPAAQLAAGADPAASAHPDRRRRRTEDAAAGGPLRPGWQSLSRPGAAAKARHPADALRGRGSGLPRNPEDHDLFLRRRTERGAGRKDSRRPGPAGRTRRAGGHRRCAGRVPAASGRLRVGRRGPWTPTRNRPGCRSSRGQLVADRHPECGPTAGDLPSIRPRPRDHEFTAPRAA